MAIKSRCPVRYKGETLSHMDKIIEHDQAYAATGRKLVSDALKEASISFGSFYRRLGRYHETQNLIERVMGDEDVSPAVRSVLANIYCDQGEFEKAEKPYTKILAGTNLAFIYWTQNDELREDGLAYENAYKGDFHPFDPWFVSVLSTYNGLGVLYMKTGHLELAETLFNSDLEGREKVFDPDDRYTAEIVNHLGAFYTRLGNLDKA
ncbi:MAG: hypothetical protein Q9183_003405 [Haloplaca sp. 2 TL-2023]